MAGGRLVARNAADPWSGTLQTPILLAENGYLVGISVWTGSNTDGTVDPNAPLGGSVITFGYSEAHGAGNTWINGHAAPGFLNYSLYGISATDLTVPASTPEPESIVMTLLGAIAVVGAKRCRVGAAASVSVKWTYEERLHLARLSRQAIRGLLFVVVKDVQAIDGRCIRVPIEDTAIRREPFCQG